MKMLVTPKRRESPESNDDNDELVDDESRISGQSSLRSKKFSPFSVDSLLFKKEAVEKSTNVDIFKNVEQLKQNVQRTQSEVAEFEREQFCDSDRSSSKHEESNREENNDIYEEETGTDF